MSLSLFLLRTPKYSPRLSFSSCKRWHTRRSIQTQVKLPPLPPHDEWRTVFPVQGILRERVSLANPETADTLVHRLFTGDSPTAGGKGKIIIEAFPGPGCLSRALLKLDSSIVKKLIILEDSPVYLEALKPLAADPRVSVVHKSGFHWDTYQYLEEHGYLDDIETVPWEGGIHPQLHFISHISHDVKGEQLVAQFFRMIPDHLWLFKYGRVPISFIMGQSLWERVTAPAGKSARCKVGVIAEATAELKVTIPAADLPYDENFHPKTLNPYYRESKPESKRLGHPLLATNIIPYANQIIEGKLLEKWDFALRRLFILKASPLKKAIGSLSPGAVSLLKVLTDPRLPEDQHVDTNKSIKQLTIADWALIMRAFDNWPFAPQDLLINDTFKHKD